MQTFLTFLSIVVGSGAIFSFIEFLIKRKDNTNSKLDDIIKRLDTTEKDNCRTQLLLMMSNYPKAHEEIMKLAEHYFADLHGDWYVSSIFHRYLIEQKIEEPIWFDKEG